MNTNSGFIFDRLTRSEGSHVRIWEALQGEFIILSSTDPEAYFYLKTIIKEASCFRTALCNLLVEYLFQSERDRSVYLNMFNETTAGHPSICAAAAADVDAFFDRDPAAQGFIQIFFFSKGFLALQAHRIGHILWLSDRRLSAHMLQMRTSLVCSVDIHPAARLGRGIFLDHASGLVIGETSVVEDDVSILHEVTLGGSGKHRGDRHPKIRRGALLCAGAKIIGNIEVGEFAKVGAGSVVLGNVPANVTVVGNPAAIVEASQVSSLLSLNNRTSLL